MLCMRRVRIDARRGRCGRKGAAAAAAAAAAAGEAAEALPMPLPPLRFPPGRTSPAIASAQPTHAHNVRHHACRRVTPWRGYSDGLWTRTSSEASPAPRGFHQQARCSGCSPLAFSQPLTGNARTAPPAARAGPPASDVVEAFEGLFTAEERLASSRAAAVRPPRCGVQTGCRCCLTEGRLPHARRTQLACPAFPPSCIGRRRLKQTSLRPRSPRRHIDFQGVLPRPFGRPQPSPPSTGPTAAGSPAGCEDALPAPRRVHGGRRRSAIQALGYVEKHRTDGAANRVARRERPGRGSGGKGVPRPAGVSLLGGNAPVPRQRSGSFVSAVNYA
eukprot:363109-Chlamydomonas_euryale.AAC.3